MTGFALLARDWPHRSPARCSVFTPWGCAQAPEAPAASPESEVIELDSVEEDVCAVRRAGRAPGEHILRGVLHDVHK